MSKTAANTDKTGGQVHPIMPSAGKLVAKFREELVKIMPGYDWSVHKPPFKDVTYLAATGIQTSGFNRLSTLDVVRRDKNGNVEYVVKSSGFGKRSPWLSTATGGTLARALRSLQNHYENVGRDYLGHAHDLERGRKQPLQA